MPLIKRLFVCFHSSLILRAIKWANDPRSRCKNWSHDLRIATNCTITSDSNTLFYHQHNKNKQLLANCFVTRYLKSPKAKSFLIFSKKSEQFRTAHKHRARDVPLSAIGQRLKCVLEDGKQACCCCWRTQSACIGECTEWVKDDDDDETRERGQHWAAENVKRRWWWEPTVWEGGFESEVYRNSWCIRDNFKGEKHNYLLLQIF